MTSELLVASIIVPARQEASDIEECLAAIAAQDHPVNRLEVIVVDGCSTDGTEDVARRALARWGFGSTAVIANEGGTASSNLNAGLACATGRFLCRVDARTRIEPHYVRTCVDILRTREDVAVVGGAQIAIARDRTARAIGIARALNNRWSMGGSPYRRATSSGESDTVYLGAFRRAELVAAGGWDERLGSNQDYDLNRRMATRGAVWFEATLRSGYLPRETYGELWRQYRRFGRAKVYYWKSTGSRPQGRQWLLLLAPPIAVAIGLLIAVMTAPLGVLMVGGAGGASLVAVEVKGASEPRGGLTAHLHAAVAIALVGAAWWSGVVSRVLPVKGRSAALAGPASDGRASGPPRGA